MDAAQVFNLLRKDKAEGKGQGKGNNQGDGEGFDEHDWEAAKEMSDEDKRELAQDIDEAIRQGAMVAGKMGSGGDRLFEGLMEPQVNWRDALREFVTTNCAGKDYSTWAKPNRRFLGAGMYMPSSVTERIGELVLAIDTSGSTYAAGVLETFMAETKSLCDMVKPDVLHIIYWDTKVCHAERYETDQLENLLQTTKPKGGGGTDIRCVSKYMAEHGIDPQAVVVLTDGYLGGVWGSWTSPVLWCVLDNKSANPSVGQTVHINTNNM
jgi:predicted metal-dependent peptidase